MKEKLKAQYPYRIELHAHTYPASGCSEISPREIVDIYAAKGYNAIVITNHFLRKDLPEEMSKKEKIDFYLADFYEAYEYSRDKDIEVILGAELNFTENHNDYLLYGVTREILEACYDYIDAGAHTLRRSLELEDSLFIQAHPFRKGMIPAEPEILDGLEIFNMHPNHNSNNSFAVRYALENDIKIRVCGTDYHHRGHEAAAALRTRILPHDSFDIVEILRSGDYIFEIGEDSIVLP